MYMYQKLREALEIPKNSSVQIRNWTPNNVKALVITRYFILVAYHTSIPKLTVLNPENSFADIQCNGSGGSLHNLLAQRQLSCLEEIYVDSVFMNYRGILDLDTYVSKLVSTASRLRYYGYIDNVMPEEVRQFYSNGVCNGVCDYCYSTYKDRKATLQYSSTGNEKSWHTKYNLRPENYIMDSPDKKLSMLLKRVQKTVEERLAVELEQLQSKGLSACLKALFMQDMSNLDSLMCLLKLKGKLTASRLKRDEIGRVVKSAMKEEMSKKPAISVCKTDLQKALSGSVNIVKGSREEFLLKYYADRCIITGEETKVKLENLIEVAKASEGLLGLSESLRRICRKVVKSSKGSADLIQLSAYMLLSSEEIESCNGDLVALIQSKVGDVVWYTDFILGMCGFNRSNL